MKRIAWVVLLVVAAAAAATPRVTQAQADGKVAALYRHSYAAEAKQDFATALARMREIRQAAGPSYFVTVRIAWLSYLAADFKTSAAAYSEAIAADPKAIEPKLGLTLPLLASRTWGELERACRDVLALDARNAAARARLAQAQYWSGNYPDAATTYRGLTAEYPSDLDYKTGLGWALLKMGRTAEARQLFDAVLAVSPDNTYARQGLAAK